ncbi:MAG: zinc-ribbon domain-containing protein [Acutalibacteraceae bacterium]
MKCKNCNYENNDSAKFCSECGSLLQEQASSVQENAETVNDLKSSDEFIVEKTQPTQVDQKSDSNKPEKSKNKKVVIIVLSLIIVIAVIIGVFFATRCKHEFGDTECGEIPVCVICSKPVGNPLEHDWSEATCTEPKTCRRCGETEGEELGHDWEEATCQKPETCKRCGETQGETLPHQSDNWKVIKKATCSEKGQEEGYCNLCKQTVTQEIAKEKHKPGKWKIEKKATIESDGKRVKRCTVCNKVIKEESIKISKAEYKNQCESYGYSTIARNPNQYKGEYGKFYGKVIQVMEDDLLVATSYTLRVALNGDYDSVILVTYLAGSDESHILEDDYINLYGEIQGSYTYESTMGSSITVPYVKAKYIDIL